MQAVYAFLTKIVISLVALAAMGFMVTFLPNSPFQAFIGADTGFLYYAQYLDYFIPVQEMIAVMEAWVFVIIDWYTFRIIFDIFSKVSAGIPGQLMLPGA